MLYHGLLLVLSYKVYERLALRYQHEFVILSVLNKYEVRHAAVVRSGVDGLLNRSEVARAVGSHHGVENFLLGLRALHCGKLECRAFKGVAVEVGQCALGYNHLTLSAVSHVGIGISGCLASEYRCHGLSVYRYVA